MKMARLFEPMQRENVGVTTHFSEIVKQQQFQKGVRHVSMYGIFYQIEALIICEKCVVTPIFFLDFDCPRTRYFSAQSLAVQNYLSISMHFP